MAAPVAANGAARRYSTCKPSQDGAGAGTSKTEAPGRGRRGGALNGRNAGWITGSGENFSTHLEVEESEVTGNDAWEPSC